MEGLSVLFIESITLKNFRKFREENNKVLLAYEKVTNDINDENNRRDDINISKTSTLIVGKNNVGKTSIIEALKKLTGYSKFTATDINFEYLKQVLETFNETPDSETLVAPKIEFEINMKIKSKETRLANIAPILFLNDNEASLLHIQVVLADEARFFEELREVKDKSIDERLKKAINVINSIELKQEYFTADRNRVDNFNLRDLIEIKPIDANVLSRENSLNQAFNKIIKYRYNRNKEDVSSGIEGELEEINQTLTDYFVRAHGNTVNESLNEIEHPETLSVELTSDLTIERILNSNVLLYEYKENGLTIPENQFGLGYTNLVMIIAEIIDYIEKSPESAFSSKINLISIEEPETYMHPQMQELFIKNINAAINYLFKENTKALNSQIIITTHSTHILNSKIHSGNSFNHINYLTEKNRKPVIVNLSDKNIVSDKIVEKFAETDEKSDEVRLKVLKFLKKHIKFKVSELFYSEAVIFVEGITEEIILREYIDQHEELSKFYISIYTIDGAHALVYHKLIQKLLIPTLVITDLDIKLNAEIKSDQIRSIDGAETTNKTIEFYMKETPNNSWEGKYCEKNLYLAFQGKQEGYYPNSFEEALILANYKNPCLKEALFKTKPIIFKSIHLGNDENLKDNSRYLQIKLNDSKNEFANRLLMEIINTKNDLFPINLPPYIKNGIDWLYKRLLGVD